MLPGSGGAWSYCRQTDAPSRAPDAPTVFVVDSDDSVRKALEFSLIFWHCMRGIGSCREIERRLVDAADESVRSGATLWRHGHGELKDGTAGFVRHRP